MSQPQITILMPVRNAEAYIDAAVDSILRQTEPSFVLLVIDDGSTDRSVERVLARSDPRIRLVSDGQQRGVIDRLNWGLDNATTDYVARMDADDISAPDRLARQLRFMQEHPEIGICGSWYSGFSDTGTLWEARLPENHPGLVAMMPFASPLAHGSVLMRRSVLTRFGLRYAPEAVHAEDYDLWERAAAVTRLANIPAMLYAYRVHPGQVSERFSAEQRRQSDRVRGRALARLGVACSAEQLRIHCAVATGTGCETVGASYAALRWIRYLRRSVSGGSDVQRAIAETCRRLESDLIRRIRRQVLHALRIGRRPGH